MARQRHLGQPGELLDVIVIGGSQAGLAMAWHLARQHPRFVVLEAGLSPGTQAERPGHRADPDGGGLRSPDR